MEESVTQQEEIKLPRQDSATFLFILMVIKDRNTTFQIFAKSSFFCLSYEIILGIYWRNHQLD